MSTRENELSYCRLQMNSLLPAPISLLQQLLWWQACRLLPRSRHGRHYSFRSLLLAPCSVLFLPLS
jgi:hypothetical protein